MSANLPGVDGQVTRAVDTGQAQEAQQDYPAALQSYLAADALTADALQASTTLPEANGQLMIRALVQAQSSIGRFYLNGQGVTQDYQEAVAYDRKALSTLANSPYADYGAAWADDANNDLGYMYAKGYGVPEDATQARQYFETSRGGQPLLALLEMHKLPDTQAELTPEYYAQILQELEAQKEKEKEQKEMAEIIVLMALLGGGSGQGTPVSSYQQQQHPSTATCDRYGNGAVAAMAGCQLWQLHFPGFGGSIEDESDE